MNDAAWLIEIQRMHAIQQRNYIIEQPFSQE